MIANWKTKVTALNDRISWLASDFHFFTKKVLFFQVVPILSTTPPSCRAAVGHNLTLLSTWNHVNTDDCLHRLNAQDFGWNIHGIYWCRHDGSLGHTFFQYDFLSYFKLLRDIPVFCFLDASIRGLQWICEINTELKNSSAVTNQPKKKNGEGSTLYRRKVNIFKHFPPSPTRRKENKCFYKTGMDDVRKFLPKAPTFFEHSTSFSLPRSSPPVCHPLLHSIIPLFFLSLAPTLLDNVRNTPGRKLLAGLFCHA